MDDTLKLFNLLALKYYSIRNFLLSHPAWIRIGCICPTFTYPLGKEGSHWMNKTQTRTSWVFMNVS